VGRLSSAWQEVAVSRLRRAPWNYKEDDAERATALKANIERNGLIVNLIVREIGKTDALEVVDGNHRLEVVRELGYETVMVVNLGRISKQEAERVAVELNETRFPTEELRLAAVMKDIVARFGLDELTETLPFGREKIDAYARLTDFDFDKMAEGMPERTRVMGLTISLDPDETEIYLAVREEWNKTGTGTGDAHGTIVVGLCLFWREHREE